MIALMFLGAVIPEIFHVFHIQFDIPVINPDVPVISVQISPITGYMVHIRHEGFPVGCDRRCARVSSEILIEFHDILSDIPEILAQVFQVEPSIPPIVPNVFHIHSKIGVTAEISRVHLDLAEITPMVSEIRPNLLEPLPGRGVVTPPLTVLIDHLVCPVQPPQRTTLVI